MPFLEDITYTLYIEEMGALTLPFVNTLYSEKDKQEFHKI